MKAESAGLHSFMSGGYLKNGGWGKTPSTVVPFMMFIIIWGYPQWSCRELVFWIGDATVTLQMASNFIGEGDGQVSGGSVCDVWTS